MNNKEEWINRFVTHMIINGFDEAFSKECAKASYGAFIEGHGEPDTSPEEWADEEIDEMRRSL